MIRSLMLLACAIALAVPVHAQKQSPQEIDSLLEGASLSLDRYQELAADVRCEEATRQSLRESCKENMEMLAERVQEAKVKIAQYRHSAAPAVVDLFDTYELFRRIMEGIELTEQPDGFYGDHNQQAFARIYNNFVKVMGWFGGVVRDQIQNPKCP